LNLLVPLCTGGVPRAILFTPRGADDSSRPLAKVKFRTISQPCEKVNLSINMIALNGRCQTAIRGFSGSLPLPCRAVDSTGGLVYKVLIIKHFPVQGEPRKKILP
jgi:hypothetical protein